MSSQDATGDARRDGAFESSAREIAEFAISVIILPITLLLAKPSAIARASATGSYRPLPSPFLLAVLTGFLFSGVAVQLLEQIRGQDDAPLGLQGVINQALIFYEDVGKNSIVAVLTAIPYLCILWLLAGGLSVAMMRGWRSAEPLWAAMSLSLAALLEVTVIALFINYATGASDGRSGGEADATLLMIVAGVIFVYTLILAVKLMRLLFVLRKEYGSPLVGAFLGGGIALAFLTIVGVFGTAMATLTYFDRYNEAYYDPSRTVMTDAAGVTSTYDEQIARLDAVANRTDAQNNELASALNSRCWAVATTSTDQAQLLSAQADCTRSLALRPNDPNTYDSRGLVNLGLEDFRAAYDDYNQAVEIYQAADEVTRFSMSPDSYFYGRGLARIGRGQTEAGEEDKQLARRLDSTVEERFSGYASVANSNTLKRARTGAAPATTPTPEQAPAP